MRRYLLLFDCDGTLVDSQNDIVAAMDFAFHSQGLTPPTRAATLAIVGLSVPEAIGVLAPTVGEHRRAAIADAFRTGAPALQTAGGRQNLLYTGAEDAIVGLARRQHLVLGVATGKSRRGVKRLFDQYGWHGHFATVQTADTNRSKPDPDMILTAMAETGIGRAETLMIGDTSFDMEMARAAGVTGVGVSWGYHPEDLVRAAGAQAMVHSFDDLDAFIGQWSQ